MIPKECFMAFFFLDFMAKSAVNFFRKKEQKKSPHFTAPHWPKDIIAPDNSFMVRKNC